ncbi:protein eiger isoform X2 [Eurosta solidaginis]|uniref:protein eiger isoform X2 n=1 Tax=Eurosta solidaginis TaxID=178769 RepID=UPI003530CFCD
MTTETLKPFLSDPRCVVVSSMRSTPSSKRRSNLPTVILSALAVILTLVLLGFTIWQFRRISHLETDVKQLEKIIFSMQKRLGITNVDDVGEGGKEYSHAFIEEPTISVNDKDGDDFIDNDDDDDNYDDKYSEFDYEEFRKKFNAMNYDGDDMDDEEEDENEQDIVRANGGEDDGDADENSKEEDMDVSDDGDLYNDFSKFNATLKKKTNTRKSRSIAPDDAVEVLEKTTQAKVDIKVGSNENQSNANNQQRRLLMLRLPTQREQISEGEIEQKNSAKDQTERKRSHRRYMNSRRYKNLIVKNAKSARQTQVTTNTPAAHFHLNRKIPDRYASIKVDSYSGDMYIGHPSWTNEIDVSNYFKVENGVLTVYESGIYYVYAQVCYNNTHDQNGFMIFHGHRAFLQCLNTVPTNMPHKIHTCHTSGLIYLKENETIHLRDFHSDRNAILKDANNRSYFGLIKI